MLEHVLRRTLENKSRKRLEHCLSASGPHPRQNRNRLVVCHPEHDPRTTLRRVLEQCRFSEAVESEVENLIALAGKLGEDIPVAISYG